MQIIVQTDDEIYEISLSDNIDGNYPIHYHKQNIATIVAYHNSWVLKTLHGYQLHTKQIKHVLDKNEILSIQDQSQTKALLFIKIRKLTKTFRCYTFTQPIHIGRYQSNEMQYRNQFVSNHHAKLFIENGRYIFIDLNSSNHVYVNRKRFTDGEVHTGDIIEIMEMQIIIGIHFISVNFPYDEVIINEEILKPYHRFIHTKDRMKLYDHIHPCFRSVLRYEPLRLHIASPPTLNPKNELPLFMKLGPSFMMGIVSISNLSFMLQNKDASQKTSYMSWIMVISMLAGTILFPFWSHVYQKRKQRNEWKRNQDDYEVYVSELEEKIKIELQKEKDIVFTNFPSLDFLQQNENFWFHTNQEEHFMKLRFGIGEQKSSMLLEGNVERISMPLTISVPLTIDLLKHHLISIQGSQVKLTAMLEYFMMRLSVEYSCKDIKIAYIGKSINDKLRWIPHLRYREFSCFGNDQKSTLEICDVIWKDVNNKKIEKPFILFYFPSEDTSDPELIKYIERNEDSKITLIRFSKYVSPYTKILIDLDAQEYTYKHDLPQHFQMDTWIFSMELLKKICYLSTTQGNKQDINEHGISILSLFSINYVEELNIWKRWENHCSADTLRVPIGKINESQNLYLDIHEKFDGPHGILAGTTGSGKSECMLTYLLSLSIQFHPYDVTYLIIDYKGGGLAKSLECMPHCVGVVTNLDGVILHRSLQALQGEIRKRQEILKMTAMTHHIANITLNDYQKLYYEEKVHEPLAHLLIICDEFAELKLQQPLYLEEIISTARIGRSLGIHLLLSTQKPNGIINDQIWSNSHFHLCMKVADKTDSMDVIKKPDAAYLKRTGELFLQVGYDEKFIKGRSAYTQETYLPQRTRYPNEKVVAVSQSRHIEQEVSLKEIQPQISNQVTQMQVIIQHILDCAKKENIRAKKIWKEPLHHMKKLKQLIHSYGAKNQFLLIGEKDDPFHQSYGGLYLPMHNHSLVYGNKDLDHFLKVLLLARTQIEHLVIYVIDMMNDTKQGLTAYSNAHIKIIDGNRSEDTRVLLQQLQEILDKQKKEDEPNDVLTIIHGYYAFEEEYPQYTRDVQFLLREGKNNHMNFIFTLHHENDINYRLKCYFSNVYILDMDNYEELQSLLLCKNVSNHYQRAHGYIMEDKLYEFLLADHSI